LQMRSSALRAACCTNALSAMDVIPRVINPQDALQGKRGLKAVWTG
jgi:hypothetical protein